MIEWTRSATFLVALLLIGALLVFLGAYQNFPGPETGWAAQRRADPDLVPLLAGLILMILAIGLFVAGSLWVEKYGKTMAADHETIPNSLGADLDEAEARRHPVVVALLKESDTLHTIARHLYEDIFDTKMRLDEFHSNYKYTYRDAVVSKDEMYYRLRVLENLGILRLEKVAARTTDVCKIKAIAKLLHAAKIIEKSYPESKSSNERPAEPGP